MCSLYRPTSGAKTSTLPVMLLVETSRILQQRESAPLAHRDAVMGLVIHSQRFMVVVGTARCHSNWPGIRDQEPASMLHVLAVVDLQMTGAGAVNAAHAMTAALLGYGMDVSMHVQSKGAPAGARSRSWRAGFLQGSLVTRQAHQPRGTAASMRGTNAHLSKCCLGVGLWSPLRPQAVKPAGRGAGLQHRAAEHVRAMMRSIWECGRGILVLLSCQSMALVISGMVPDSRQFCMLNMSRLSEVVQSCARQPGPHRSGRRLASPDMECEAASSSCSCSSSTMRDIKDDKRGAGSAARRKQVQHAAQDLPGC